MLSVFNRIPFSFANRIGRTATPKLSNHTRTLLLLCLGVLLLLALPNTSFARTEKPMEFNHTVYSTMDPESKTWVETEIPWATYPSFWHHWENQDSNFRYVIDLTIFEDLTKSSESYYLVINMPGSYMVKLDGNTIGQNGEVTCVEGRATELKPGKNRYVFIIPNHYLSEGKHRLELDGFRTPRWVALYHAGISIKPLDKLIVQERWHIINYGSYLVYFIFGVFFLSNFITRRESIIHFYLGVICLLFSTFALNKLAYYHLELSYRQAALAMNLVYSLNYVIGLLAHLLLFESLAYKRKYSWMLLPIPLILAWFLEGFDSYGVLKIIYIWLAVVALFSIVLRRPHAVTAAIISATLAVVYAMRLFEKQQFVIYFALFLYLLFSIALAIYKQNKEKQEALLTNTRLNLELVKNKIQPHFILNSITSAMEWIESNPKQGAAFLNALAREFEVLSRMTDQKLIPLGMEIDSCKNYLKVMEFRKKASYELKTTGVDVGETLPPSIIRNLLENAISHNSFGKQSVTFSLEQVGSGKRRTYIFRSPYSGSSATASSMSPESPSDGTGIQYIKARLMESYKNRWSFHHGPEGSEWVTNLDLF